jgi:hypothetical protein
MARFGGRARWLNLPEAVIYAPASSARRTAEQRARGKHAPMPCMMSA